MHLGFEFLASAERHADAELIERCLVPLLAALHAHPGVHCDAAIDEPARALLRAESPAVAALAWVPEGAWRQLDAAELRRQRIHTLRLHHSQDLLYAAGWLDDYLSLLPGHGPAFVQHNARQWTAARVLRIEQVVPPTARRPSTEPIPC